LSLLELVYQKKAAGQSAKGSKMTFLAMPEGEGRIVTHRRLIMQSKTFILKPLTGVTACRRKDRSTNERTDGDARF
jgi:hypothetical protein